MNTALKHPVTTLRPPRAKRTESLDEAARRLLREPEASADGSIRILATTVLPTDFGTFDVRLFTYGDDPAEHMAISVGDLSGPEPMLVRMHSECFTGEVLHSQKCDCGQQLAYAQKAIQSAGRGIVLYLRQEGRGIGLANKLRAYALQAMGADTVDANRLLGLPDDSRSYAGAAAMLRHLGVTRVRLMTNNPAKVSALEEEGIEVTGRQPVLVITNATAAKYLETKRDRMSHAVPTLIPINGGEGL